MVQIAYYTAYTRKSFFVELKRYTNFLDYSPWEDYSSSASHKILRLSWNPKIHYCTDSNKPLDPALRQMNSLKAPTPFLEDPL
jgi:hypothetical protein